MKIRDKPARSVWKAVRLIVAFHKDRDGKPHLSSRRWFARDGRAGIHHDPDQQEAVLVISSSDADNPRNVDVSFRQDRIDLIRDDGPGWDRIIIEDGRVSVRMNGHSIRILADGSVAHLHDGVVTHIDPDLGVLVASEDVQISISMDGELIERRTPESIVRLDRDDCVQTSRRGTRWHPM